MNSDIQLWWAQLDLLTADSLRDIVAAGLPQSDSCKCQRLVDPDDRWRCLLGRAALRAVLARVTGIPPTRLPLSVASAGKPQLDMASAPHFNLSHCGNLLVMAVSTRGAVGVDLEFAAPERAFTAIAQRYFSDAEYQLLVELPGDERQWVFCELWTLKEAYIKAAGDSLGSALMKTLFCRSPDGSYSHISSGGERPPAAIRHHVERLDSGYCYSVALLDTVAGKQPVLEHHRVDLDLLARHWEL